MSDALAALDRHDDAAKAATQALEVLAPFVERYPQTYNGLARAIGADVLKYSEAAGQMPDAILLARVAKALGGSEVLEQNAAIEALKAKVGSILEAAAKSGALDETALAELPVELADQVRGLWAERAKELAGNGPSDA
jgi:phage-related protein